MIVFFFILNAALVAWDVFMYAQTENPWYIGFAVVSFLTALWLMVTA